MLGLRLGFGLSLGLGLCIGLGLGLGLGLGVGLGLGLGLGLGYPPAPLQLGRGTVREQFAVARGDQFPGVGLGRERNIPVRKKKEIYIYIYTGQKERTKETYLGRETQPFVRSVHEGEFVDQLLHKTSAQFGLGLRVKG